MVNASAAHAHAAAPPLFVCMCSAIQHRSRLADTCHCSCFHLQPLCADLALAIALDEMPEHGHSPDPQLMHISPAASQQVQAAAMTGDPNQQLGEEGSLAKCMIQPEAAAPRCCRCPAAIQACLDDHQTEDDLGRRLSRQLSTVSFFMASHSHVPAQK